MNDIQIIVSDVLGRKIDIIPAVAGKQTIKLRDQPKGAYILEI
jgi:hypothetical protein